jgi:serine protease DegS
MLQHLGRGLTFVAGSVVGGLALAFVIVALRPELIRGRAAPASAPAAAAPAPTPAVATPVPAVSEAAHGENAPERASFADAVQRAEPAVVNVYTDRVVTERVSPSLGELFGEFVPRYRQRIERTLGSGVIVDDAGHIVTNDHVIANAESIRVQLADGRIAEARVVGTDPDTDLAVLKVSLKSLPVAPLGRSDQLRVGDVVLAIGNPLGLSHTVTHGIVSAVSRAQLGIAPVEDFIQTDAPINRGNSGGALVDSNGALVGINTAMVAKSLGVEGIGFAIPVNLVRGVVSDIIDHGRVIRGWIGIAPEDLTDEQAQRLGLAQAGVVVVNLYVGSPAQQAGLKPGDLLLAVDGVAPRGAQDVLGRISRHKPGSTVTLKGLRGRQSFELAAHVTERPRPQRPQS